MNNTLEENIERYLQGRMNDQEVKDFENRLASDEHFAKEFESTRAAYQFVKLAGRKELTKTLESFEKVSQSHPFGSQKYVWLKPLVSVAAVLIFFIAVYEFAFHKKNTIEIDALYDKYFTKYSDPSLVRNSQEFKRTNWDTAVRMYRNQKYNEAIMYFGEAEVPNYLSSFYSGLSYLQQKTPNYEAAIKQFEIVLQSDNDYTQQALWYKGLALLKLAKAYEALSVFTNISRNQSYNFKSAKEIVTVLNNK